MELSLLGQIPHPDHREPDEAWHRPDWKQMEDGKEGYPLGPLPQKRHMHRSRKRMIFSNLDKRIQTVDRDKPEICRGLSGLLGPPEV